MQILSKDFGEETKQLYYKGIEFTVNLIPFPSAYKPGRLAEISIECNGITTLPSHLITPELWHDEKAREIIVYDLAKFLY